METGTIVYLRWYDFVLEREDVLQGEVIKEDEATHSMDIRFQPSSLSGPIVHTFPSERLSLTNDPNTMQEDPATEIGEAAKQQKPQQSIVKSPTRVGETDYETLHSQLKRYIETHWDATSNHLQTACLQEYYELWRACIAAKMGFKEEKARETNVVSPPETEEVPEPPTIQETKPAEALAPKNPTRKQLRSSGRIAFRDSIQTSIFD